MNNVVKCTQRDLARPVALFLGLIVSAWLLSGCTSQEGLLVLESDEFGISCEPTSLPVEIHVEDLDVGTTWDCTPVTAELIFPDGTHVLKDENSGTSAFQPRDDGSQYTYTDVGIYGLFATYASMGCADKHEWGTTEAQERVYDAFGDDYGCPEPT